MHKSKILALLLAVVMVASMIVVPVYAAEGAITYGLRADKTTVAPGEEFVVTVSIDTNPGFTAAGVNVHYDDGLTVTAQNLDLIYDSGLRSTTLSVSPLENNPQMSALVTPNANASTGDIFALTFVAEAEGTYEISLDVGTHKQADNDLQPLETDVAEPLTITVAEGEAAEVECELHEGVTTWTEIAEGTWTGGELATGHYKLTGNQTLTAALEVSSAVCIDLNGHTITSSGASNHRIFNVTSTLVIMDSSKNETGIISGGKTVEIQEDGYAASSGDHGGNFYVNGGELYIYGGTITGGIARRGGNIFVNTGKLHMYGGTVTAGNGDYAGNIYIANGSGTNVANIYGGTISDGKARTFGPNLYVSTKSSNSASNRNTVNIYGGTFSGGTSADKKASIFNQYSKLHFYGGNIDSSVGSGTGSTAKTSTYIYGGTFTSTVVLATSKSENNVYNGVFTTADVSDYRAACACVFGNTVWHYVENCSCDYTTALADATASQYITQQVGQHTLAESETSSTSYACSVCNTELTAPVTQEGVCAHANHGTQTWLPWTGVETDGHFFVEADFTLTKQVTVKDGETLCLDLNGETVTAESTRMFLVEAGGTLNLMDSAENGTLKGTEIAENGAVVSSAGTFNLYSGTIQDGFAHDDSNIYGGNIYINGGSFNMSGGTVKDGKVINTKSDNAYGGNIYIVNAGTTATISGGNILNGDAGYRGGNIGLNSGATMTIENAVTVEGGAAATYNSAGNGANIFVAGTSSLTIKSGVTIGAAGENNEAAANIIKASKATLKIYGGVTLETDAKEFLVEGAQLFDASEAKYVTYATLAAALADVAAGDTVALGAAETTATEKIYVEGYTLDLNGKILNATTVDATAYGHVVDSTDGQGQLNAEEVLVRDENSMQHIVVAGVSYFENVEIVNDFYNYESGASEAKYYMYVNKLADNTKVEEALTEGTLQMGLLVTWTDGEGPHTETFVLDNKDLIAAYVTGFDSKMLMVSITGLENVTALECEATLVVPVEG